MSALADIPAVEMTADDDNLARILGAGQFTDDVERFHIRQRLRREPEVKLQSLSFREQLADSFRLKCADSHSRYFLDGIDIAHAAGMRKVVDPRCHRSHE